MVNTHQTYLNCPRGSSSSCSVMALFHYTVTARLGKGAFPLQRVLQFLLSGVGSSEGRSWGSIFPLSFYYSLVSSKLTRLFLDYGSQRGFPHSSHFSGYCCCYVFEISGFNSHVGRRIRTLPGTALCPISGRQSADVTFQYHFGSLGTRAEAVIKQYVVPGTRASGKAKKTGRTVTRLWKSAIRKHTEKLGGFSLLT